MSTLRSCVLALTTLVLLLATAAGAQQQEVRPPIAQYWMDVATNAISGLPGIPGMPSITRGEPRFGNTQWAFGRYVDIVLAVRTRPQGIQATQSIPQRMQMGTSLMLDPVKAAPSGPGDSQDPNRVEKPKGRLMLYWGCGAEVRTGQPRVLDMATATPQQWDSIWGGRYVPERGATAEPGRSIWPNDRDKRNLPDGNSLQGEHGITGDGVPPGFRFGIGPNQDLMPALELTVQGQAQGSILLQWRQIPAARSYFVNAFGQRGNDFILWSSSELPDAGIGLLDYLTNAEIGRWTADKVLLPPAASNCAVPRGIFAGAEGAIVRMIAHGEELNLVSPPRPADPRTPWEQQWTVRVRVKSTVMAFLTR